MSDSHLHSRQSTIEDDADFIYRGYEIGYLSNRAIERWAEIQIEAIDQPPIECIELATIRLADPFQVLKWLNNLRGNIPRNNSVDTKIGLIALCFFDGKLTARSAIGALLELNYADALSTEQRSDVYLLEDDYENAIKGRGCANDVANRLGTFLASYATNLRHKFAHIISLNRS